MIRDIIVPKYIQKGITKNHKGYHNKINVLAGDVETNQQGLPYLILLQKDEPEWFYVDNNPEEVFIDWLYENASKYKKQYKPNVIFFHNLGFDLGAIFHKHHKKFLYKEFFIRGETSKTRYMVNVKFGDCKFGTIYLFNDKLSLGDEDNRYRKRGINKQIEMRDSFAFFNTSLKKIANDLTLEHRKKDTPIHIDQIQTDLSELNEEDRRTMLDYAMYDVMVQKDLSDFIMDLHGKYDLKLCCSIAQLASRIFKHRFLDEEDMLTFPNPYECQYWSELSYHGGKNGFYLDRPQIVRDVYEVDVNSMYPYAMIKIPNFNHSEYHYVDYFEDDREGIYKVNGFLADFDYPILATHKFKYLNDTYVEDLCVTSFELRRALDLGIFSLDSCQGYIVEESKGEVNPLHNYVKHFYKKKQNTPKSNNLYYFYKIMLNSLYGKFQQATEAYTWEVLHDMIDKPHAVVEYNIKNDEFIEYPTIWRAGGLYSPMISSLITGFSRSYLHELETKYNAFDSSTDSIKTQIKPKNINNKLGGLGVKNFGDCLFIRNKFYIHFGEEITYAKHGCKASLGDIIKMYIEKKNRYDYQRMVKIRESIRRKEESLTPLTMHMFNEGINVKW